MSQYIDGPSNAQVQRIWAQNMEQAVRRGFATAKEYDRLEKRVQQLEEWMAEFVLPPEADRR